MSTFYPLVAPNFVATVPISFARNWEIYVRPRGGSEGEQVDVYSGPEDGAAILVQPLITGPAGRIGEGEQIAWVKGSDLPVDLWGRPSGREDTDWQVLPEGDDAVVAGGEALTVAESKASKAELEELAQEVGTPGEAAMGFANHGEDAAAPRPAGYSSVTWMGSVEPSNAADGDIWIQV